MCWFCRAVWPAIHQRRPEVKLQIVGRRPAPAVQRLSEQPGVEVVGQVPDIRPFVQRAAVAVVPLQIARGVQNKVLEALAMGTAVVASPMCVAALHAQAGVHLRTAATAAEWIDTILELLGDEGQRRRLGVAGRRYVEEQHRWDVCLEPLGTLLTEAAASAQATSVTSA
jgi:glycosyltransferase involved in cell wall biosynthesis